MGTTFSRVLNLFNEVKDEVLDYVQEGFLYLFYADSIISWISEAWQRHGVTSMDILSDIMTKVITKIAGRRRSNNYNQRKRIQQFCDKHNE